MVKKIYILNIISDNELYSLEYLKLRIPSVDEDMKTLELSPVAGGNAPWCIHFTKWYSSFSSFMHKVIIWSSNFTPRYILKSICPYENLYDCFSSLIYNNQKCLSTNKWLNETQHIHVMEYLFHNKNNYILIKAATWSALWKHSC